MAWTLLVHADASVLPPGNLKKDATMLPSHGCPRGHRPTVHPSVHYRPRDNRDPLPPVWPPPFPVWPPPFLIWPPHFPVWPPPHSPPFPPVWPLPSCLPLPSPSHLATTSLPTSPSAPPSLLATRLATARLPSAPGPHKVNGWLDIYRFYLFSDVHTCRKSSLQFDNIC
jgi:hypothetical protein